MHALRAEQKKCGLKVKSLILDTPTRWNSTHAMLERFLELKDQIDTCLDKYRNAPPMSTDAELAILSNLKETLFLFERLSTKLCRRDMTLAKADQRANFYLQQIQDEGTLNPIAERLGQELLFRLNQRRNKELCGLALYLESAGNYESVARKSQLEFPPKSLLFDSPGS